MQQPGQLNDQTAITGDNIGGSFRFANVPASFLRGDRSGGDVVRAGDVLLAVA